MKLAMIYAFAQAMIFLVSTVSASEISCKIDSDCNDNNPCTVDMCTENAVCRYDYDCKLCGLSKLVSVDIYQESNQAKASWEIVDYETNEQVMANDTNSYSYDKSNGIDSNRKCLRDGAYLFVIDSADDDSRYEVRIGDQRRLISGVVRRMRTHFFLVNDKTSRLRVSKNSI